MAGKRLFNEFESDKDPPADQNRKRLTTLRSVVGQAVMANSLQNLFSSLEPLLRRVVNEEVEDVMRRCTTRSLARSSSLRIEALEPSSLKLVFSKGLQLPIFTGTKIQDAEGNPLRILVVDKSGSQNVPVSLAHPIKVEIVILDGDFPPRDETWTSAEFDKSVVKERAGKRPLLHGDLTVTLRDGSAVVGDTEFTDNSSWTRSRRFRIGARVVSTGSNFQGLSVGEAMTEAFMVKDHRGELYKKHYPPKLEDKVWRLEKIGKDGAFHKKLSDAGIKTVQDFLKMCVIDASKLRKTLGLGMSEKMWEVTLKHAMTCEMGNKKYIYRGDQFCLTLNPICQVIKAEVNGQVYSSQNINNYKSYFENLIRDAYDKWDSLEVVDGIMNDTALLTQGDMMDQQYHNQAMMSVGYFVPAGNVQMDGFDLMQVNTPYFPYGAETSNRSTISESSSDGDLASQQGP